MPRYKSLLRWEPFPYLVLLALLLATGFIRPDAPPVLLWPFVLGIAASLVWVLVAIRAERRDRNPDAWGNLTGVAGLDLTEVPSASAAVRTVVPVIDTHRHQAAIDLARLHGGAEQQAVLVPRASRWMSMRYRVGVQLVGGDRPRHAGYLPDDAQDRWGGLLEARRVAGGYLSVPAFVLGEARPHRVELDLSGLGALEATA